MNDKKYPMKWPAFGIACFVLFQIFPPAAVFLILYQFGFFKTKKQKATQSDNATRARYEKYKIMTAGRDVESIEYLASALGVPFETALRDLQTMVAEGQFGAKGYINYVDRTIVMADRGARSEPVSRPTANAVPPTSAKTTKKAAETSAKKQDKKSAAKEKGIYGAWSVWLLVIAIFAIFVGVMTFSDALDLLAGGGLDIHTVREMISALVWGAGGIGCLTVRSSMKKRENRIKTYIACMLGCDCIAIADLAKKAGVTKKTVLRDIEIMLEKGTLSKEAYVDQGNGLLILKSGAAPKKETVKEPPKDDEDRYNAILRQIRQVNDDIPDPELSARIDEMEELTAAIFAAVREKPEKEPQIKSFMSYYLPTALKLLRSYADFDKSGAEGDNVRAAKKDIERILDTLVEGFRKQLDKLYESDAMDISADINVLETMLRRDGLSGDGSGFGTPMGG